ncbi:hypothetical protein EVG20_g11640, partial [Dentipellis fragilis]
CGWLAGREGATSVSAPAPLATTSEGVRRASSSAVEDAGSVHMDPYPAVAFLLTFPIWPLFASGSRTARSPDSHTCSSASNQGYSAVQHAAASGRSLRTPCPAFCLPMRKAPPHIRRSPFLLPSTLAITISILDQSYPHSPEAGLSFTGVGLFGGQATARSW